MKIFLAVLVSLLCLSFAAFSASNPAAECRGVKICGSDYECGAADNVCPSDYGAACSLSGSCADPDCGKANTDTCEKSAKNLFESIQSKAQSGIIVMEKGNIFLFFRNTMKWF